ncbi:MAG: 4Fe-4S dicluster domain-containing protein [Candidatus Bathyarchaeia archaeon]|nr:4Fe-4S dicluster domain-containing protein [Candidatus Bathyarchaeota archaeon]
MSHKIGLVGRNFVVVDPSKCIGCSICEFVCALEKEGEPNPAKSRIRVIHLNPALNLAVTCRFCENAPCIRACPHNAIKQSERGGILIIDEEKCDGCVLCIQACPYGGIMLNPDKMVVIACDLCDGKPQCVDFCPEEALKIVSDDKYFNEMLYSTIEKLPKTLEEISGIIRSGKLDRIFIEAEERGRRIEEKLKALRMKGIKMQVKKTFSSTK